MPDWGNSHISLQILGKSMLGAKPPGASSPGANSPNAYITTGVPKHVFQFNSPQTFHVYLVARNEGEEIGVIRVEQGMRLAARFGDEPDAKMTQNDAK
jgi:hypothetical protein